MALLVGLIRTSLLFHLTTAAALCPFFSFHLVSFGLFAGLAHVQKTEQNFGSINKVSKTEGG
jgi:hypothetical protein